MKKACSTFAKENTITGNHKFKVGKHNKKETLPKLLQKNPNINE